MFMTCFNSQAQYDGWMELLRQSGGYAGGAKTQGPCWDCTPEYHAMMVEAHRCEHPETVFETTRQGELTGTWKKHTRPSGVERTKILELAAEAGISERSVRRRLAAAS